jgi:hypothetical protein
MLTDMIKQTNSAFNIGSNVERCELAFRKSNIFLDPFSTLNFRGTFICLLLVTPSCLLVFPLTEGSEVSVFQSPPGGVVLKNLYISLFFYLLSDRIGIFELSQNVE